MCVDEDGEASKILLIFVFAYKPRVAVVATNSKTNKADMYPIITILYISGV